MYHVDLEQATVGDRRLSFTKWCTDCEDDYKTGEKSSVSSMSNSEDRECRICKFEVGSYGESLIELGCLCKEDMAFAHQQCAETWFEIKGDKVCEICQSVASNVAGGNEMIAEEVLVVVVEGGGGGGDAAVVENVERWWQRHIALTILFIFSLFGLVLYMIQKIGLFGA